MKKIHPYIRVLILFWLLFSVVPLANASSQILNERQILGDGWVLFNAGDLDKAEQQFQLIKESKDSHIRFDSLLGLGYIRLKQNHLKAAQVIFSNLVKQKYNLEKTLPALLQSLHEGSEQRYGIAHKILNLNPSDVFALSVVAWHYYHKKKYPQARTYFTRLLKIAPNDSGAVIGLGYSLLHQNQHNRALQLIEQSPLEKNKEIIELKQILLSQMIQDSLEKKDIAQALSLYQKITDMDSPLFIPAVSHIATRLLDTLMINGNKKTAWNLAKQMADSKNEVLKDAATSFFFTHESAVLASQTKNSPDACYYNANSPHIEGFAYHFHRSGDPGTSQLDENIFPASFVLPVESGQEWRGSWVFKTLDSGTPKSSRTGSYYLNVNGDRSLAFLGNSADVQQFFLGWKKEGHLPLNLQVGTSPLNSDVSATPVFKFKTRLSDFRIEVHRESIEESILSYAGLKDPYGRSAWGRVTRNGSVIGKSLALNDDWWFSSDAGFDLYRGESVEDNHSWQLDLAIGQTSTWKKIWEFTWGGYAAYKHFDKNSNFFTYGHGGYYSPEYILSAGPLFRLKSIECKDFWIDIQISLGWMTEKVHGNAYYPLKDVSTSGLSSSALNDLNGQYDGNSEAGPTASIQMEGWKMLSPHIIAGVFGAYNHSPAYDEWLLGFGVSFSLKPLIAFWDKEPFQDKYQFRKVLY
ncbi:MAG: tetratricopeptide repeat protein [Desulfobacteraceae bacterium]|nr:tetratricopeptide repeat protein [Desulfobacteraceae bacterium]